MQHDVYFDALQEIIDANWNFAEFSSAVLVCEQDVAGPPAIDHRTLQNAHDLLAAAWRYRNRQSQRELFEEPGKDDWVRWLQCELSAWRHKPALVRDVLLILKNQNTPIGFAFEGRLALGIMQRFPDVPWKQEYQSAFLIMAQAQNLDLSEYLSEMET